VSYGSIVSSATIAEVDGEPRVYVGGGMTMYAIDAVTGERVWEFDAGTGCTTCDGTIERNEITSSPAVLPEEDLVLFGMDINDSPPGKGGFFAVSASDGRMRWYFDTDTLATCRPDPDDEIRKFDGYHPAEALGLPEAFFASREGCDFDRTETACGGVWSPVSVDRERELIYFVTTNCDTDDDPTTERPSPPMPGINEGLAVLNYDGTLAWKWRPREVDNDDLAFGAAPNLFTTTIGGVEREVVGIGGKDGTYYLLDRDGENELSGEIEPYWERNLVPGGAIGGMLGSPAAGDGRIYLGTGIGEEIENFQKPAAWTLNAADGEIVWSNEDAPPTYSPTSAIPGLVFIGGIDASMHAYDADTGELLRAFPLGGLMVSSPAIVDGELFVGSGFGAKGAGDDIAAQLAGQPAWIWGFCIQGQEGCEGEPIENFQ
jgi:polyvinyl alcohol dehydrogenase (cytochrome)